MVFKGLLDSINKEKKRKQAMKTAKQVAIGVGIVALAAAGGMAAGILIAPKSGKEIRDEIQGCCNHCISQQGSGADRCQEGAEGCSSCGTDKA